MSTPTNCPNCGAPITGPKCEYCGTVHNFEPVAKKPRAPVGHDDYCGAIERLEQIRVATLNERRAAFGLEPIRWEKTQ